VFLKMRFSEAVAIARRLVRVVLVAMEAAVVVDSSELPSFLLVVWSLDLMDEAWAKVVLAVGVIDLDRETMAGLNLMLGLAAVGVRSSLYSPCFTSCPAITTHTDNHSVTLNKPLSRFRLDLLKLPICNLANPAFSPSALIPNPINPSSPFFLLKLFKGDQAAPTFVGDETDPGLWIIGDGKYPTGLD